MRNHARMIRDKHAHTGQNRYVRLLTHALMGGEPACRRREGKKGTFASSHAMARAATALLALGLLVSAGALSGHAATRAEKAAPAAQPPEEIREIIEDSCTFCHGDRGEASNPIYPRLAAQNRDYLIKQLKNFRDGKRKSDIMNEQAADLTDAQIEALADWFSRQPPLAHKLSDDEQEQLLFKVGEYVFKYGDPYADIPPCMTCHGRQGEGSARLPRLAGQHRQYIIKQLKAFSKRERTNDNAIMHSIVRKLSPLAMQGVALYLSILAPEASTDKNKK